jgi:hypothetical protein
LTVFAVYPGFAAKKLRSPLPAWVLSLAGNGLASG